MGMPFEERLGGDVKRVEHAMTQAKQQALRPTGLTVPQYVALLVLADAPGISAAELARRCRVTPQTMTTILRNLETASLIARVPHDVHRNVLETRLTEAGRRVFAVADEHVTAVERRMSDALSAEERTALRALLSRVADALS
ncbi:MarR family winged helix-turn-helix transcriptional regulator [Saccharothrix obliqua]|uniref:MarR family winged helix-turn-helix transcriptional regulator n=1 Tax=Saccharothrix obliqua TaxID=2861747 RepID=UPI001C5E4909|nr:MarR family transcriptional regulator [Saccharothrix obliqua]MBW4719646.1 MarR family transcriptional regulator [Saccharothrix obliqua]